MPIVLTHRAPRQAFKGLTQGVVQGSQRHFIGRSMISGLFDMQHIDARSVHVTSDPQLPEVVYNAAQSVAQARVQSAEVETQATQAVYEA